MLGKSAENIIDVPKRTKKMVRFDLEKNSEHLIETYYPKGQRKPSTSIHQETKFPVDIYEKKQVKKYLENHDEQFKGFILTQYRNQQDGSYAISFVDPASRAHFKQTFMQERIDEILEEMRKIKASKVK